MITPDPDKDEKADTEVVDFSPIGDDDPHNQSHESARNQSLDAILAKPKMIEIELEAVSAAASNPKDEIKS